MIGRPCVLKGNITVNTDGSLLLKTITNVKWTFTWSAVPEGLYKVRRGDLVQANGRCVLSTRPYTLVATKVAVLASSGGDSIRSADAGPLDAWATTLPKYFASASFGALSMPVDPAYNKVLTERVKLDCEGELPSGYWWTASRDANEWNLRRWGDAVDNDASSRLSENLDPYQHHVYLMPNLGMTSYGVMINDPPLRTWITSDPFYLPIVNTIHELGHNLGLAHAQGYDAAGNLQEYGDGSCPMGFGPRLSHYNAPNSYALGWTTPQAVLQAGDLQPGVWKPFKLRGLADSPVSSLQILPNTWSASGWQYQHSLWVSFRRATPNNTDAELLPMYRNKVQVHRWTPDVYGCNCGPTTLLSTLDSANATTWPRPGSTAPWDTASPLLVVRVSSIDEAAGAAYVSLCRKPTAGSTMCR
ncbi:hypothetical protein GPECTOR_60g722 [Gonium pectorale]|uniref:Peptidase M11 gametolysin domain-containing protein n=1 Tax=Gonium pectorale TaxID=33097 RepID=A0A150G5Y5_GONPE|nr:hypothetical protein GPECTOR_60g722 [Gonium pectorale]|eukprot:KXZ44945.1 hypothetical protein GPECTOR_60g722 [Gonium pectorale]